MVPHVLDSLVVGVAERELKAVYKFERFIMALALLPQKILSNQETYSVCGEKWQKHLIIPYIYDANCFVLVIIHGFQLG
jgi:hypothetical protein